MAYYKVYFYNEKKLLKDETIIAKDRVETIQKFKKTKFKKFPILKIALSNNA